MPATLALLLIAGKSRAGDSGAVTLAAGETFSVRINGVYRDIRVCNDRGSAGEIIVVISQHEPAPLAPGECRFGQGDTIHLENISPSSVRVIYLVVGVHQS